MVETVDTRLYLGTSPLTGRGMWWDVAKDPGMVLIAPVGSGKSFLAQSLVDQSLAKAWDAAVFDPKRMAYRRYFEALTHEPWLCDWTLSDVYEQFTDMSLGYLFPEYRRRMELIESLGDPAIDEYRATGQIKPLLVVMDELQAMMTVLAFRTETDDKGKKVKVGRGMVEECQGLLASMLALFRASGIVPVLIAQTGNTNILPSEVKNNAPAKVQLGNTITDSQWLSLFGDTPPSGMPRFVGGVGKGVCQLAGEVDYVDIHRLGVRA
jgi:hypothetical protein